MDRVKLIVSPTEPLANKAKMEELEKRLSPSEHLGDDYWR
jgi:hypothetical protein